MSCPEENVIVDFVRGELPKPDRAEIERHIDECGACSAVVAEMARIFADDRPLSVEPVPSVAPNASDRVGETLPSESGFSPSLSTVGAIKRPPEQVLPQGSKLGRYVVIDRLGAGGMGVVYAAYDPELDRRVALKVLRSIPRRGAKRGHVEQKTRLLREAQAMAKLSHPNVITVHDVGTFEDQVFLAMEFIEGCTLGQWLRREPRSWREVRRVFLAAGQGLVAAHECGLVHRDFKPDNVLIGNDGRILVLDFGLARPAHGETGRFEDLSSVSTQTVLHAQLTQTGALVGTPAYMAPEQLTGDKTDALTDQFSFCVALYEGLYGERPFAGKQIVELVTNVTEGNMQPVPRDAKVPRYLRRAVLRGLAREQEERYPTMRELLAAIRFDPWRRWRRWGVVTIPTAVLAVGIVATQQVANRESTFCDSVSEQLDGVWDTDRRGDIEDAFSAAEVGFADRAFKGVAAQLDEYSERWVIMQTEVCQDELRAEQPQAVVALRNDCLERRLASLRTLTDLLAAADRSTILGAADAARALPELRTCADLDALTERVEHIDDPETQEAVNEIDRMTLEARLLLVAGKYEDSKAMAQRIIERSREIDYRRGDADGLLYLGRSQANLGDPAEAEMTFHRALSASLAAGHPETMARAAVGLVWRTGRPDQPLDEAERWAAHGLAALEQLGGDQAIEMELNHALGVARHRHGDFAGAHQSFARVLDIVEQGGDTYAGSVLTSLGHLYRSEGHTDKALEHLSAAREEIERHYGPEHPNVATALDNLGLMIAKQGRMDEARPLQERALKLRLDALGPDHPFVGGSYQNLSVLDVEEKRWADALENIDRALEIFRGAFGERSEQVVSARMNRATIARHLGDLEDSIQSGEDTLRVAEGVFGEQHPRLARQRYYHADNLAAAERWKDSVQLLDLAIAVQRDRLGAEHPHLADSLLARGRAQRKVGRFADAVKDLEAAVVARAGAEDGDRADALFALAQARSELRTGDKVQARSEAERARGLLASAASDPEQLAEIERWLAER